MNDFTGPNGIQFTKAGDGSWRWESGWPPAIVTSALRELFRAEEDERLGRWRWPENPEYIVYPGRVLPHLAGVIDESTGLRELLSKAKAGHKRDNFERAAAAYFDAHPEQKPWSTPEAGEVWVLDVDHIGQNAYVAGDFSFLHADHSIPIGDPRITAGRRLWPEVSA